MSRPSGSAASAAAASGSSVDSTTANVATPATAAPSVLPRDAECLIALLTDMGLKPGDYQPQLIAQMIDFVHMYSVDVLEEAQEYAQHRNPKAHIDVSDIELAVQRQMSETFVEPPPREILHSLAATRNVIPLPIVPTKVGVVLPFDPSAAGVLLAPNYRVRSAAEERAREQAKSSTINTQALATQAAMAHRGEQKANI